MRSIFIFPALALSVLGSFAVETQQATSYAATVTGVVCGSCKAHITEAFKKLPDVENVEFAKGEKENTQRVTFSSSAGALSKEDAVKVLGNQAGRYEVLALDKVQ